MTKAPDPHEADRGPRLVVMDGGSVLRCDACGRTAGRYHSYEAWEDAARSLGWEVGEYVVLCAGCAAY